MTAGSSETTSPFHRVHLEHAVDLLAPQLDAHRVAPVHRVDLDGVAAHTERALREVHVVALVVQVDEPGEQLLAHPLSPTSKRSAMSR